MGDNSFWAFRNGPVISPSNRDRFEAVLGSLFRQDAYQEVRRKSCEYAFSTSNLTAETVMSLLLSHPKIAPSKKLEESGGFPEVASYFDEPFY